MVERVKIQPDLLRWARNRVDLAIAELVEKFPKYRDWEAGRQSPTMRQLEQFATKTRTPLGYLFLSKPPIERLPIPDFRTIRDQRVAAPSPDLLDTIHLIQRRQAWAREYLVESGAEPIQFIGSASIQGNVAAVAAAIRNELGLEPDWARSSSTWEDARRFLIERIERAGIMVMINGVVGNNTRRPLDVDEFRGFVLCDAYAPLIFLNNADSKSAQMFSLAHELAHLWLGEGGVINLDRTMPGPQAVEKFCNRVAAEFLVPATLFLEMWRKVEGRPTRFEDLAKHFKVSPIVAARRALDLKKVTRDAFGAFFEEYLKREWKKSQDDDSGGGDFQRTARLRLGDHFTRLMYEAVRSERLSYTEAYRLTDLRGLTFDKYIAQYGGQP